MPDVSSPADALRRDAKYEEFKRFDTDALKEVAKLAYARVARFRNELAPFEEDLALARRILFERLLAENRTTINDTQFDIYIEEGKPPTAIKDDVGLFDALHALVIDGEPLPSEVLAKAAWIEEPPPLQPVKKTDLTKIKQLAKRYGDAVDVLVEKFVTRPPATKRLVFLPKETLNGEPGSGSDDGIVL